MQENYLYPGDEVTPIEIGEGYRDYWLSEVLKHCGYTIEKEGCEPHLVLSNHNNELVGWLIPMLVHLSCGKCIVLAPINYFVKDSVQPLHHILDEGKDVVCLTDKYEDLRIRFFIQNDVVSRPVWLSTNLFRRRYVEHNDIGEDVFVYRSIEVAPGAEPIPYCAEIIEGTIFEPDLVSNEDLVNKLLKSPYIDYAE